MVVLSVVVSFIILLQSIKSITELPLAVWQVYGAILLIPFNIYN